LRNSGSRLLLEELYWTGPLIPENLPYTHHDVTGWDY